MEIKKEFLNLGELIIKMRKEKGYSQRKFAQISGLSNTTISRIENGETLHPDVETLRLLAMHLDIDAAYLINAVNLSKGRALSKKNAKLNYYKKPVKRINRYSSVFSSAPQQNEPKQESQELHTSSKTEEVKKREWPNQKVSLKGMRLITLRLEKNITQKELADALGIDKTLISQYEGEIIKPDFDTFERLAQYFGVTLEYLSGSLEAPIKAEEETIAAPIEEYAIREAAFDDSRATALKPEYIEIARDMQKSGIEPEDIRAFINIIKKNQI